jgi:hypothetical protein
MPSHNKEMNHSIPLLDRIEKEQPIQQTRSIGKNPGTGMDPAYSLEESNSIGQGFDSLLLEIEHFTKEWKNSQVFTFLPFWFDLFNESATFDTWLATPIEAGGFTFDLWHIGEMTCRQWTLMVRLRSFQKELLFVFPRESLWFQIENENEYD